MSTIVRNIKIGKIKWTQLRSPPYFIYRTSTPAYYYDTRRKQQFMMISPNYTESRDCIFYNIDKDEYGYLATYPENFDPYGHQHAINQKDSKYYIFGGANNIIGEYDLIYKKWNIYQYNNDNFVDSPFINYTSAYIPYPIHQIHLASYRTILHQKKAVIDLNKNENEIEIEPSGDIPIDNLEFHYSEPLQTLFAVTDEGKLQCFMVKFNENYDNDFQFKEIENFSLRSFSF